MREQREQRERERRRPHEVVERRLERIRPRREEPRRVRERVVEVLGDVEAVRDDRLRVGVVDDGKGVEGRAVGERLGGGRADLEAEGLDVWVLDPDGLVRDALDVQDISTQVGT